MSSYDYIIVGSGISGMSFAHAKASVGKKVLVLEKKDYAGGCVCSLRHEDFWLELGGHTIYNSYMSFIRVLRELGIDDRFSPRDKASFKMFRNGNIEPLMSSLSKVEAAFNVPKMFFMNKSGKSVRQYYSAVLGKNNYENMFQAMLQAVISQDASGFPADMLLKKRERDKTAPRNFTLKGGMSSFIDAVCDESNVDVKINCEVVDVAKSDGKYSVETSSGERFDAENIVMACPPPMASALLSKVAGDVAGILSEIGGVRVETFGLVVKKSDINVDPFSFIIAKDDDFTSAVSRDILPHDKYRGVAFHFRDGVTNKEQKLSKIEDVLGIDRGAIVVSGETVHFSPTLDMNHKDRLARLNKAIHAVDGLYVIGNYFGGLAIEDCMLRSMEESSR